MTIYVVGDIHGRSDLLDEVHGRIFADEGAGRRTDTIEIYLGDYIDRGPDSAGVLSRLLSRRKTHRVILLRGNHEVVMEEYIRGRRSLDEWKQLGGADTLISYGLPRELVGDRNAEAEARREFVDLLPNSHLELLRTLRRYQLLGRYLFVHAGIDPTVPLEKQSDSDLYWSRRALDRNDSGYVIVHGHTPKMEPEFRLSSINIDTGAYATHRLTCLRIDKTGVSVLPE